MKKYNNNKFIIHDGVLEKYNGKEKTVTIPNCVHTIGDRAFEFNDYIREIILTTKVQIIESSAFFGCGLLESISFNENVKSIGRYAFAYCDNLKSITLPNSVEELGESVFCCCKNLETVILSDNLIIIPNSAFEFCENLGSIIIPDSVEEICEYAFKDCEKLSDIVFSPHIKVLENPFDGTDWLSNYLAKNKILIVGDTILAVAENVTEYKMPETIRRIAQFAFCKSNIENLFIPDTVEWISPYAFTISNIKHIRLPKSLKIIAEHTFSNCTKLEELTIPASVVRIGDYALYNLPNCIVTIENSEKDNIRIYESSFGWEDKKACVKKVRGYSGSKAIQCAVASNLPVEIL